MMTTWFSVFLISLVILSAKPTFSLSLQYPNPNFPSFHIFLRSTPFNFSSTTSFSSNFTFEIGDGVALVIFPADSPGNTSYSLIDVKQYLVVEFHVDFCVISSSRAKNHGRTIHDLKEGVNLSSWIDYHAILKRVDVRLSKLGDLRPVEPLISYDIDLGKMWKNGEKVLFGLALSKNTTVHSWSSNHEDVPKWIHSNPVNPMDLSTTPKNVQKKKDCFVSGFVFAMGCGVFAALLLFFVWSYVARKQQVRVEPSVDFKYEKIGVVQMKNSETGMK